ncbi:MAG: tRNA preQ1(34) S-adenosylmethionine ribosyltransferase-isomerase QueA [Epsilonproteobacteria bacterium]|nr:tRNA preQ1(34) S-adenosylmethionine ribosyltransferase-isomerase QueA [Campylobacterota bacterium]
MKNKDLLVSSYDYNLPKELIASTPAIPADSAKLLVYERNTKKITDAIFRDIIDFIPKETAIIFNNTKVIKARIFGKKSSGGKVELLVIKPLDEGILAMVKGRVKVGTKLIFQNGLSAVVKALNSDGSRVVEFFLDEKKIDFNKLVLILEKIGHIPLPPYMNREDTKEDERYYQSIFAKEAGSVAAPTASLHFTPSLLEKLKSKFDTYYLTLHVGAGTFKPVEVEDIREHKMHSEFFKIPRDVAKVIDSDRKILAVGTTATRTIEEYIRSKRLSGQSSIFLHPLNPAKRVDYLLTNFHLPKSTLLMLVSSFIGREETLRLYNYAIDKKYRFYSYGDAMLII